MNLESCSIIIGLMGSVGSIEFKSIFISSAIASMSKNDPIPNDAIAASALNVTKNAEYCNMLTIIKPYGSFQSNENLRFNRFEKKRISIIS